MRARAGVRQASIKKPPRLWPDCGTEAGGAITIEEGEGISTPSAWSSLARSAGSRLIASISSSCCARGGAGGGRTGGGGGGGMKVGGWGRITSTMPSPGTLTKSRFHCGGSSDDRERGSGGSSSLAPVDERIAREARGQERDDRRSTPMRAPRRMPRVGVRVGDVAPFDLQRADHEEPAAHEPFVMAARDQRAGEERSVEPLRQRLRSWARPCALRGRAMHRAPTPTSIDKGAPKPSAPRARAGAKDARHASTARSRSACSARCPSGGWRGVVDRAPRRLLDRDDDRQREPPAAVIVLDGLMIVGAPLSVAERQARDEPSTLARRLDSNRARRSARRANRRARATRGATRSAEC